VTQEYTLTTTIQPHVSQSITPSFSVHCTDETILQNTLPLVPYDVVFTFVFNQAIKIAKIVFHFIICKIQPGL
jgi:hypothetical protein